MENKEDNKKVQWQPIIEMIIVLMTILGSTIPLYMHTDSKIEAFQNRNYQILEGIRLEMKDFHTKLALQDQEFKLHMIHHHEERNRK